PVMARVTAALDADGRALDARLTMYRERKRPVWLAVAAPMSVDAAEGWRALLAGVLSRHGDGLAVIEIDVDAQDAQLAAYVLRLAATEIRAARDDIRIAVGGPRLARTTDLYTADLAPYLDLLVLPDNADVDAAAGLLKRVDPGAQIALVDLDAGEAALTARRTVIDRELRAIGTDVVLHAW